MSYNRAICQGNLTKDPEAKTAKGGAAISKFTVAVNTKYKQGNDIKEEVLFMETTFFGKQAEACNKYLKKGYSVLVEGRLKQSSWNDSKDANVKHYKTELIGSHVSFLNNNKAGKKEEVPDGFIPDDYPGADA